MIAPVLLTLAIASLAFLAGLGVGYGWARMKAAPSPYYTATNAEAETYRAARGLQPGAPIPRREYWQAVKRGEIENPPWVKTPEEME